MRWKIFRHNWQESREFIKGIYVYFAKEGAIDEDDQKYITDVLESEERDAPITEEMLKGFTSLNLWSNRLPFY